MAVDDTQALEWFLKAAASWKKRGNLEKAHSAWDKAAKISPDDPRVQQMQSEIGAAGPTRQEGRSAAAPIKIFKADYTALSRKLGKVFMIRNGKDYTKEVRVTLWGTKVNEMLNEGTEQHQIGGAPAAKLTLHMMAPSCIFRTDRKVRNFICRAAGEIA